MESIILDTKKTLCIVQLTNELPVLRARLALSQEEVASRVGISRQTYNAIESKKREMSWNVCIALAALFGRNVRTRNMMKNNSHLLELLDEVFLGQNE